MQLNAAAGEQLLLDLCIRCNEAHRTAGSSDAELGTGCGKADGSAELRAAPLLLVGAGPSALQPDAADLPGPGVAQVSPADTSEQIRPAAASDPSALKAQDQPVSVVAKSGNAVRGIDGGATHPEFASIDKLSDAVPPAEHRLWWLERHTLGRLRRCGRVMLRRDVLWTCSCR